MRYFFTGTVDDLKKLGFVKNVYNNYWYLPHNTNAYNCITICENGEIENIELAPKVLEGKYKIVKD